MSDYSHGGSPGIVQISPQFLEKADDSKKKGNGLDPGSVLSTVLEGPRPESHLLS
jgi:hypothetical protein